MTVALACDCHLHIYDPTVPGRPGAEEPPRPWGVVEYRELQQRLGLERAVVVTPSLHGTDNRATLKAIRQLGSQKTRGVAVVHPSVTDDELDDLHAGGVRGIRFTQYDPRRAATTPDMIAPLAGRIQRLGWHVQLHLMPEQIVEHRALIEGLPGTLVFDHLLRLGSRLEHPALDIVATLIGQGRAWVKLSGAYLNSKRPGHADTTPLARALIALGPDRMVWGSDWPHPTEHDYDPDDRALLDLLSAWAPDPEQRHRILVDNPAALYDF